MLFVILTLLCVVASLSQAVELVGAEYRPGRFNRRIPARNDSVTVVITSSLDILAPSLTALSSEVYHGSIDAISDPTTTLSTNDASIVEESSGDGLISSTSDTWWTLFNLGTITTVRRPTLTLPTTTPIRITSSTSRVFIQPGVTSDASVITYLPPTTSSFASNGTSRPWGWNTTSIASPSPSSTITIPPSKTSSSSIVVTATPSECPARGDGRVVVTSYSITYTSTTTWSGDPADYTPPYPSISLPVPCTPKETPTGRFTITFCDSTGQTCTFIHTTTTANGLIPGPSPTTETVTFTTTDKNPAVVFPTETPPSYGGEPADPPSHDTIGIGDNNIATPDYGMLTTDVESAKSSPTPQSPTPSTGGNNYAGGAPITVIAQPGEVVIDDHTFTDNPSQQTSTVVVGSNTFVIEPSRVIGAGVTITRSPSGVGDVAAPIPTPIPTFNLTPNLTPIPTLIPTLIPAPTPITTTVGGIGVVYGPSVATIDGTVFTIESTSTVAVVRGQTITFGPAGIVFPSQTLHAAAGSGPTQTAVMGGELITAIGTDVVVVEGTTITYGHGASSTITTVIDGETVLIAPTGVVIRDTLVGGVTAAPSATKYEIVGGATITQMGLTAVEIGGKTFHVGLGASTAVTTIIGGHTLTIGPKGVGMSTWTLGGAYPYATTTTIIPGGGSSGGNNNAAMTVPTATGSPDKENGAASIPRCRDWLLAGVGVGCLGPLLLFWL
ncbi:hypothetical protein F4818DRAFT_269978 [Hypoxylon cercidicola]|nr:hypothetical protein F4818DRAFT_269978 [Hypoxylon cercidicola]